MPQPNATKSATTPRLAVMNPPIQGIEADFGPENSDTFWRDLYPVLRADTARRVSANPNGEATWRLFCDAKDNFLVNLPFSFLN